MPHGPKCSEWARAAGVDPVGTATAASAFLLVEWPLPWPPDANDVDALHELRDPLRAAGGRLQLLVPSNDETRDVILYRQPERDDDWYGSFLRASRRVPPDQVVAAALELLAEPIDDDSPGRDVLVCGHGARDRCCGARGTSLAMTASTDGLAVRRTSHLGGHRFAPTAAVLPDGTMWGFLDVDSLRAVTSRSGPVERVLPLFRGSAVLDSPLLQAAERAVFATVGWEWLEHARRVTEVDGGRVRVDSVSPNGARATWDVEVDYGRELPVPKCGLPLHAATKTERELSVVHISRRDT